MTPLALAPVDTLEPIDLAALNESAELQTRVDRKYILPARAILPVLRELSAARARVLEVDGVRALRYTSLYFDTPRLDSYFGAVRGRRRRFKVRARSYLDSGGSFLEVKTRGGRSATVKERVPVRSASLDSDAIDYATDLMTDAGIPAADRIAHELVPTLETAYRRITVLVDDDAPSRATIDLDLRWNDLERGGFELPGRIIVETKSTSRPGLVDRTLWRSGHRPDSISKYGTGLAVTRAELPHNKWHRVIGRHFSSPDWKEAA